MTDLFHSFHEQIFDPARLPVVILAWLLCVIVGMVTGPMHGQAYPFFWLFIDKTFGKLGGRLDNRARKKGDLVTRGMIFVIIVAFASFGFGRFFEKLIAQYPLGGFAEILFLSLTLTAGTIWFALLQLYFSLRDGKSSKGAYFTIAQTARTNLSGMDDFGITRNAMMLSARVFARGLIAPSLWYLILGLSGAYLYIGVAVMAWRFGKDGYTKGFGAVALALDKFMGFVPDLLAAILIALAGLFTPTGGMYRAFKPVITPGQGLSYYQGGKAVTAMAYSLNISLGGAVTDLDGSAVKRDWTGPKGATAQLEKGHLRRALYLMLMANLLWVSAVAGAMIYG